MGCCSSNGQIVFFLGSLRKASLNNRLLHYVTESKFVKKTEIKVIIPDLSLLPFFTEEYQSGQKKIPKQAIQFIQIVQKSKAIIFVTPEYNGSVSPLILNAYQWLTMNQQEKNSPLKGKRAGIISASYISQGQIKDIQIMSKNHLQIYEQKFYVDLKKGSMDQNGDFTNNKIQQDFDDWIRKFIRFSL